MEMKNKILDYIDDCGISVAELSQRLQIDKEKLDKESPADWNAEELLQICAYLKIDPVNFYTGKLEQE